MKILFLDHDDVICLWTEHGGRYKHKDGLKRKFDRFNQKAVKILNQILKESDAEIVVSSDWRNHGTLEEIGEWYEINGIIKKPIDVTTSKPLSPGNDFPWSHQLQLEQNRGLEIRHWLQEHPEVTHWVAVDDLNLGMKEEYSWERGRERWGLTNFVHVKRIREGIKQTGLKEKILLYLK